MLVGDSGGESLCCAVRASRLGLQFTHSSAPPPSASVLRPSVVCTASALVCACPLLPSRPSCSPLPSRLRL